MNTTTSVRRAVVPMLFAWLAAAPAYAAYDLDTLGVPRFVRTNYIELSKVQQLSRFRSSAGHDYSDSVEHCRSMKHYFMSPDSTASIVAPVAGTVSALREDFVGTQVQITSDLHPDFVFIIFHVAPAQPLTLGQRLTEGQLLGTHVGRQTYSDIAVGVNTSHGYRLVSYFDTLTEAAFAPFRARGIADPSQLVIGRAERDAAPYRCSGQQFIDLPSPPDAEYVTLLGSAPPAVTPLVSGPITGQTLHLVVSPPGDVLGLTGSVFVGALLPPERGSGWYLLGREGWARFAGCATAPAAYQGSLIAGLGASAVPAPSDLSALRGTTLYVGYGIGSTVAGACQAMQDGLTYRAAYTVQ